MASVFENLIKKINSHAWFWFNQNAKRVGFNSHLTCPPSLPLSTASHVTPLDSCCEREQGRRGSKGLQMENTCTLATLQIDTAVELMKDRNTFLVAFSLQCTSFTVSFWSWRLNLTKTHFIFQVNETVLKDGSRDSPKGKSTKACLTTTETPWYCSLWYKATNENQCLSHSQTTD